MRATPVILLILIVCLPLALLMWLGSRMASDEQTVIEQQFRSLLTAQLRDIDQITVGHFAMTQRELRRVARLSSLEPDDIRARLRKTPLVRQVLLYSPDGEILHPDPGGALNSGERDFLLDFADLIMDRDLFYAAGGKRRTVRRPATREPATRTESGRGGRSSPQRNRDVPQAEAAEVNRENNDDGKVEEQPAEADQKPAEPDTNPTVSPQAEGWHIWYLDRGVHLFYWQRLESGHVVGLLAERSRWMADLIATLPQTVDEISPADPPGESTTVPSPPRREGARRAEEGASRIASDVTTSRIRLLDSAGEPMYEWGSYEPKTAEDSDETVEKPLAEIPVSAPLSSWRLQAFVPPELVRDASRSARFSMTASLVAAAVALCLLVGFFWREYRRELREASQRVSFVNQVSHELRTPLTNIRMYADLLDSDLDGMPEEDTGQPKGRLRIIVEESQRLSRLIGNVLTMARQQRKTLALKPQPTCVDNVIGEVLQQFEPALTRCGVEASFEGHALETVPVDVDVLEQILVNLFSNVEKYAASGGVLKVASSQTAETTTISVSDAGPGIASRQREAIFKPFFRSSDRLEDAAGTGIGLSIARELAQLHGGDLRLVESESGATFEVELKTV